MTMKVSATGMSWYRREDYPRILQIMLDAHKLHKTFNQWEKSAIGGEKHLIAQGHMVVRAIIVPDKFITWCRENRMLPNASARSRFATELARQKLTQVSPNSGQA